MEQIRRIVVPVDFEQHTDKLVQFAVYIATDLGAEIIFFHVTEQLVKYIDFMPTSADILEKDRLNHAKGKMNKLVEKFGNKYSGFSGKTVSGNVVDDIVCFAKEDKANLIIIGTHGHKGIDKLMLGSVAERVVKHAPCPVLVYNPYR